MTKNQLDGKMVPFFMDFTKLIKKLGFDEKETKVYLILLSLGPSSVRKIAEEADINRGTTYDILKKLMNQGIVAYYHKEKKQYFTAEDPSKLMHHLENSINEMQELKEEVLNAVPALKSIYNKGGGKAVARYYEGSIGMKYILEDVLDTMNKDTNKKYYVYSSADLRGKLYKEFSDFTEQRIKNKIAVNVIALGQGGEDVNLSERKWIKATSGSPAYTIIYGSKTANIALDSSGEPFGVVVEDQSITDNHKIIFEHLWSTL